MLSISVNIKNSNIMASAKSIVKLVVYALVIFCFIACSEKIEDGFFESGI